MEMIVEDVINFIIVFFMLGAAFFMVKLICAVRSRIIILPKSNSRRRRSRRPVQQIGNGNSGPIIFPNTGDVKVLHAFIDRQCELAHKAIRKGGEKRMRHHVGNIHLALKDPKFNRKVQVSMKNLRNNKRRTNKKKT